VKGLDDGVTYSFRISAVYQDGNESSLSILVRASPADTEPPVIILLTTPRTIVGTITFTFTGSVDLQRAEMEYYNDSNGNGLLDDAGWEVIGNGTPSGVTWDTSVGDG
jgi:hypothetical protein